MRYLVETLPKEMKVRENEISVNTQEDNTAMINLLVFLGNLVKDGVRTEPEKVKRKVSQRTDITEQNQWVLEESRGKKWHKNIYLTCPRW